MNLFFLQGCFGPQNKRFLRGKSDPYRERPFLEAKNSDHPKLGTINQNFDRLWLRKKIQVGFVVSFSIFCRGGCLHDSVRHV